MSDRATEYVKHVHHMEEQLAPEQAAEASVGGEFFAIGRLEYLLLRSRGLKGNELVIDVGCGSGRLAAQLVAFPDIKYVGCDVVPRLLEHARARCKRDDWEFAVSDGERIPAGDSKADFVCFFSVFTHLTHEQTYRYLLESVRVLKPGGTIVFSFLEFRIPSHWANFFGAFDGIRKDTHLNQFIDRDAIKAWATNAGLAVQAIHGGDTQYIPIDQPITFENGSVASGAGSLGQSVAILKKPLPRGMAESAGAAPASANVNSSALAAPIRNLSVRAHVRGGSALLHGFVIGGSHRRELLIRAVGPTLQSFGVEKPLPDPVIRFASDDGNVVECIRQWSSDSAMGELFRSIGAFDLPVGSRDVAIQIAVDPGRYTAIVEGLSTAGGEVLFELYFLN